MLDPVALKNPVLHPVTLRNAQRGQLINNYATPVYTNFLHLHHSVVQARPQHQLPPSKSPGYYGPDAGLSSPQANGFSEQVFNNGHPGQHSVTHTIRVNYDQTLTPTTLLHFGAGLLHLSQPGLLTDDQRKRPRLALP